MQNFATLLQVERSGNKVLTKFQQNSQATTWDITMKAIFEAMSLCSTKDYLVAIALSAIYVRNIIIAAYQPAGISRRIIF